MKGLSSMSSRRGGGGAREGGPACISPISTTGSSRSSRSNRSITSGTGRGAERSENDENSPNLAVRRDLSASSSSSKETSLKKTNASSKISAAPSGGKIKKAVTSETIAAKSKGGRVDDVLKLLGNFIENMDVLSPLKSPTPDPGVVKSPVRNILHKSLVTDAVESKTRDRFYRQNSTTTAPSSDSSRHITSNSIKNNHFSNDKTVVIAKKKNNEFMCAESSPSSTNNTPVPPPTRKAATTTSTVITTTKNLIFVEDDRNGSKEDYNTLDLNLSLNDHSLSNANIAGITQKIQHPSNQNLVLFSLPVYRFVRDGDGRTTEGAEEGEEETEKDIGDVSNILVNSENSITSQNKNGNICGRNANEIDDIINNNYKNNNDNNNDDNMNVNNTSGIVDDISQCYCSPPPVTRLNYARSINNNNNSINKSSRNIHIFSQSTYRNLGSVGKALLGSSVKRLDSSFMSGLTNSKTAADDSFLTANYTEFNDDDNDHDDDDKNDDAYSSRNYNYNNNNHQQQDGSKNIKCSDSSSCSNVIDKELFLNNSMSLVNMSPSGQNRAVLVEEYPSSDDSDISLELDLPLQLLRDSHRSSFGRQSLSRISFGGTLDSINNCSNVNSSSTNSNNGSCEVAVCRTESNGRSSRRSSHGSRKSSRGRRSIYENEVQFEFDVISQQYMPCSSESNQSIIDAKAANGVSEDNAKSANANSGNSILNETIVDISFHSCIDGGSSDNDTLNSGTELALLDGIAGGGAYTPSDLKMKLRGGEHEILLGNNHRQQQNLKQECLLNTNVANINCCCIDSPASSDNNSELFAEFTDCPFIHLQGNSTYVSPIFNSNYNINGNENYCFSNENIASINLLDIFASPLSGNILRVSCSNGSSEVTPMQQQQLDDESYQLIDNRVDNLDIADKEPNDTNNNNNNIKNDDGQLSNIVADMDPDFNLVWNNLSLFPDTAVVVQYEEEGDKNEEEEVELTLKYSSSPQDHTLIRRKHGRKNQYDGSISISNRLIPVDDYDEEEEGVGIRNHRATSKVDVSYVSFRELQCASTNDSTESLTDNKENSPLIKCSNKLSLTNLDDYRHIDKLLQLHEGKGDSESNDDDGISYPLAQLIIKSFLGGKGSSSIITGSIPSYSIIDSHVVYKLEVNVGSSTTLLLYKRYSELETLYRSIKVIVTKKYLASHLFKLRDHIVPENVDRDKIELQERLDQCRPVFDFPNKNWMGMNLWNKWSDEKMFIEHRRDALCTWFFDSLLRQSEKIIRESKEIQREILIFLEM